MIPSLRNKDDSKLIGTLNDVIYGYVIEEISLDLASTGKENSLTEYEAKFMSQGVKINYLRAIKK